MGLRPNIKTTNEERYRFHIVALTILVVGAFLVFPWASYADFTQPLSHPPSTPGYSYPAGDSISSTIQGNNLDQTKLGSFLIGEKNGPALSTCTTLNTTGCSQFCLNSNPLLGASDAANCVSSWSQLSSLASIGGPFVRLFGANSASIDSGYANVKAADAVTWDNIQLVSVIAESYGGVGPSGSGALRTEAYSGSSYTAQFAGTLVIDGPYNTSGTKLYPGRLCLNDQTGSATACITSWNDILSLNGTNVIRLQDVHQTTASPDLGNASAVGPVEVPTLVIGQPIVSTAVTSSCGDGICSSINGENPTNCAADCS